MDALILAAGRGERMRPLSDDTPKPLLEAGGRALIEHTLEALAAAGYRRVVINYAHLGKRLVRQLGKGRRWGMRIDYSDESDGALETGGGILKAMALLESDPFLVVNGDIWTDYPFARLPQRLPGLAHLVLVDNPPEHPEGDFVLAGTRVALPPTPGRRLTFSGIAVYRRALFDGCRPGAFPLAPLLHRAARAGQVSGEHYAGTWYDIGTPERLAQLRRRLGGPGR